MYNYVCKNGATGASVSNIRKNGSRAEATEQKNTILASATGSAHASFTVLTVNVLGSFFTLEM